MKKLVIVGLCLNGIWGINTISHNSVFAMTQDKSDEHNELVQDAMSLLKELNIENTSYGETSTLDFIKLILSKNELTFIKKMVSCLLEVHEEYYSADIRGKSLESFLNLWSCISHYSH